MTRRRTWIIGVTAFLVLFGQGTYHLARLSLEQQQLRRRLHALQAEHERLATEEIRLRSDATYVEGLIRSTFKQAKPGEYVVPLPVPSSRREKPETRHQ